MNNSVPTVDIAMGIEINSTNVSKVFWEWEMWWVIGDLVAHRLEMHGGSPPYCRDRSPGFESSMSHRGKLGLQCV